MEKEIWIEINGFEGIYDISTYGNVKSRERVKRCVNGFSSVKERFLKSNLSSNGYLSITLSKEGKRHYYLLHQLMAINFLKHIPCNFKIIVDHKNNIKTDNRIENLQLLSNRENCSKDSKGKTGFVGVYKEPYNYRARIYVNGKSKIIGYYKTPEEASAAYQNYKKENN